MGGPLAPRYDVIRADAPDDFVAGGFCVESNDGDDAVATDTAIPAAGAVQYYLVRAENDCGAGAVGPASGGGSRTVPDCPGP